MVVARAVVACAPSNGPPTVTLFAAAYLTDALYQIATAYKRAAGWTVRLAFGGSRR